MGTHGAVRRVGRRQMLAWAAVGLLSAAALRAEEPFDAKTYFEQVFETTKTAKTADDFTRIIEKCQAGLARNPEPRHAAYARQLSAWAYNRRGEVRDEAGQDEAAWADFNQAVEIAGAENKASWRYLHNRGVTAGRLGKYEEAQRDFDATVKLNPTFSKAWYNRGEIHFLRDDLPAAAADYEQAIKLDPQNAAAYNSRGFVRYRQGKYEEAIRDYTRAIELDGKFAEAYVNRADARGDLGQYEQALADYRAAVRVDQEDAWALRGAAWIMATCPIERFRNATVAVQAADRAVQIAGGDDPLFLDTQAAAYANAGNYARAAEIQAQVLEAAKDQPESEQATYRARLDLYQARQPYRDVLRSGAQTGRAGGSGQTSER